MTKDKPTDPAVIASINACIDDLNQMAKDMRDKGDAGTFIGIVLDNVCALEMVRDWGAYGGKVPSPVSEPSHSLFKKHGIESLIHASWKPRHRTPRPRTS